MYLLFKFVHGPLEGLNQVIDFDNRIAKVISKGPKQVVYGR